jgi:hypothetical protein
MTWQRTYIRRVEITNLTAVIIGVTVAVGVWFGDHVRRAEDELPWSYKQRAYFDMYRRLTGDIGNAAGTGG